MTGKDKNKADDEGGNLLARMLEQASDLDFTDPFVENLAQQKEQDPSRLMVEGFEVSKLFAIIEFAFLHAKDEDGMFEGMDMMSRQEAIKKLNGVFLFTVTNSAGKKQEFLVEMRKTGTFYLSKTAPGVPAKLKPDVTVAVNDKDLVLLSTGRMNPQAAFLKGKLKVKGNLMLGLRCQSVLQAEVAKMSRL